MRKMIWAAAAATALISTAAVAAVAFDSTTGTGFVGKGDIQILYGWNNAQLQRNASGVTFGYDAKDTYDVECYWETTTGHGTIVQHDITVPRHVSVSASVSYDARVRSQITGFILKGFGAVTSEGQVPVVGGSCPGGSQVATITSVTPTGSTGGLSVSYGGVSYPLPNTPIL